MNQRLQNLLQEQLQRLQKMVKHLLYSRDSVSLPVVLDNEQASMAYEALSARFSRLQDGLIPVFRTLACLELEQKKSERILDLLHVMEKYGIVASVTQWQNMRELRNAIAHEYWDNDEALGTLLENVWHDSVILVETVQRLQAYCVKEGFVILGEGG